MPCQTYNDLALQRRAAWDRYRLHAYRENRHLREVGAEQAAKIATDASRQRHDLSLQMFEHQAACAQCRAQVT